MSTFFTKTRVAITAALTGSAIVMSLFAFAPTTQAVNCPVLKANDRFKVAGFPAVYIVDIEGRRRYIPNSDVYFTWYSDFNGIITIAQECVDNYASGGGINYRPGSMLVKSMVSPSVFMVGQGNTKHKITSEGAAVVLMGPNWTSKVRVLSDAWDANLNQGSPVPDNTLVNGMMITVEGGTQVYFVDKNVLKKVVGTLPAFLSKDVRDVRQALFDSTALSTETVTPAYIVSDPTQGGLSSNTQTVVPQTPVQTTEPTTVNPQTLETGGNFVDVVSCKQVGKDIEIKRVASDTPYILTSSCRDAGHGLREYTMSCGSNTRYYVSWKPCSATPNQSVSNPQTNLIASLTVGNSKTGTTNLYTGVSYGGGVSYPWTAAEVIIPQTQEDVKFTIAPAVQANSNTTYSLGWVTDPGKVDFTNSRTQSMASVANFSGSKTFTLPFTDYYRGKWLLVYAFARNNDGVSEIPGMPVEVDDVSVARVYIPAKTQTTPVQTSSQTDLISKFWVNEDLSTDRLMTAISYGSGVGYPWYPAEATIAQNVNKLRFQVTPNVANNLTYAFVWFDNGANKVDFTEARTKDAAGTVTFKSTSYQDIQLTDYYRGKWVLVYVFVRNNDGVSGVPNMAVEVDDIAVARVYIPAKTATPVVTGPNLSLMPTFVTPGTNQVLTNYPRTAEISFGTLFDARHYEVEVYCDYCGASLWSSSPYKYTVLQPSSGYAKVTTVPLAGDNQFRTRVRAVYVDKVTGNYLYGAWTDYRYFSYKTSAVVTPPATNFSEISASELEALQPKTINFEDATGEIITKYVASYGVTIWSNNGKAIYVDESNRGSKTRSGLYSIFNNGTYPKTSYNDPLFLGFNTPVKAFGFYLIGNGNSYGNEPEATITIYGPNAKVLATYKRKVSDWTINYFGFKSDELIYKVDIDYGASYIGEGIDDLMVVR